MTQNSNSEKNDNLIIPKLLQKIALWVHPEGKVTGSLFVREQSYQHQGHESALEVLNGQHDFVVLKRDDQKDQLRFYNKSSIIRIEYQDQLNTNETKITTIKCKLYMMDGSLLEGSINEDLPYEKSRLFDYINEHSVHFIRIHISENDFLLINKSYIIRISPVV